MQADTVLSGHGFLQTWIAHELAVYGVESEAFYLAEYADSRSRFLIATEIGVLDLTAVPNTEQPGISELRCRLHGWEQITDMLLESEAFAPRTTVTRGDTGWWSQLHLVVPAIELDATEQGHDDRSGLGDFARQCARHVATLRWTRS